MPVPELRIQQKNSADTNPKGSYVLYWMIANRRTTHNYSLDRAVELAQEFDRPLLIFEALRCDYKWASVRLHQFVIEGMADNEAACREAGVSYYPYVEPAWGQGSGLLDRLAQDACAIVTDDFPCFFLPRMVNAVSHMLPVRIEAVDSNGLYPMRATDRIFTKAFSFRNHLQKTLTDFLSEFPVAKPLSVSEFRREDCLPRKIQKKWSPANPAELLQPDGLRQLPIDQSVGPGAMTGGEQAARTRLSGFVKDQLERYADDRNQPDEDPSSGLSPYLHFGHISAHEVFRAIATREKWTVSNLGNVKETKGSREGWWGMSRAAEGFLDELITWREIGYNAAYHDPSFEKYESLPDFARKTLSDHANDTREFIYSYEQLRDSETHDEIWNAAQNQLVTEGRMHNYLRMLWGKKILEWTPRPQDALEIMVDLNNRFALDGRNPNSYSGIFWVLGRYDRAWGPERRIFGKIRFMSSDSTRKKLKLKGYLAKYGVPAEDQLF